MEALEPGEKVVSLGLVKPTLVTEWRRQKMEFKGKGVEGRAQLQEFLRVLMSRTPQEPAGRLGAISLLHLP